MNYGDSNNPSASGPPASGLIVDSDWKAQAQAERERLAAAEKAKPKPVAAKAGSGQASGQALGQGAGQGADDGAEQLPEANFKALIGTLITNALMYLGAFPDPQTGRAMVAPEYAKFHIDLLAVLQEKTKGNLSGEEQQDLDQSVQELRAQFVEVMRAVTTMAMKSEAQRQAGGAGGFGAAPGADAGLDVAKMGAQLRGQV